MRECVSVCHRNEIFKSSFSGQALVPIRRQGEMSAESEVAFTNSVVLLEVHPLDDMSVHPAPSADSVRKSSDLSSEKIDEVLEEDTTCDYTFCAPIWCQRLRSVKIMLFWMSWCTFVQSLTTNGFVNSVITTLERRYRLKSTESGAIASLYDVGVVIVLIPLSYYGGNWRRLRVLAWGMLVMGIGCFLFALPQATGGRYIYGTPIVPKCYRNENVSYDMLCQNSQGDLNNYKYLFWFAHLLIGIGVSPLYTLGTAYMDENLSKENSALYLGIFYAVSILGPGLGYVLAASLLDIFVDIGQPHPGLTPANREIWVGAWWVAFLISGSMAIISFFPLYGFPKELPKTAAIRAKKKSEAFGNSEASASEYRLTVKDFLRNTKLLFLNPTFMFISISGIMESLVSSGFSTFGPKFLEVLFQVAPASATRLFGFVLVPAGGLGMFLGGFVIRVFKMSMVGILRMQFIGALTITPFLTIFILNCGPDVPLKGIAGISTSYDNSSTLSYINLTSSCNADCKCISDSALFEASCASNRVTYYSPCFAGCTTYSPDSGFGNCTCISSNATVVSSEIITNGACATNCTNLPYFLIVFGVIVFLMFFIATPSLTTTLRSVPEKQKTFALGVQWLILRIFGTIPGPIIFGMLIDITCKLWNEKCGVRGSCAFYKGSEVRTILIIAAFVLKALSAFSLMIAWLAYKKPSDEENKVEENGVAPRKSSQEVYCHDNMAMEKEQ